MTGLFTSKQWFKLPIKLRRQWWSETNYNKLPPSPELVRAIKAALNGQGQTITYVVAGGAGGRDALPLAGAGGSGGVEVTKEEPL